MNSLHTDKRKRMKNKYKPNEIEFISMRRENGESINFAGNRFLSKSSFLEFNKYIISFVHY